MEKLIEQIKQWGIERGIDKQDPLMQTTKTLEECIELQQALIKHDKASKDFLKHYKSESRAVFHPGCIDCQENNLFCEDIGCDDCVYYHEIKDAIGDIFVTIVMLTLQDEEIPQDVLFKDSGICKEKEPLYLSTDIIHDVTVLQKAYAEGTSYPPHDYGVNSLMSGLYALARKVQLPFYECVEHAYNEIKDRKGTMVNGLFVKES